MLQLRWFFAVFGLSAALLAAPIAPAQQVTIYFEGVVFNSFVTEGSDSFVDGGRDVLGQGNGVLDEKGIYGWFTYNASSAPPDVNPSPNASAHGSSEDSDSWFPIPTVFVGDVEARMPVYDLAEDPPRDNNARVSKSFDLNSGCYDPLLDTVEYARAMFQFDNFNNLRSFDFTIAADNFIDRSIPNPGQFTCRDEQCVEYEEACGTCASKPDYDCTDQECTDQVCQELPACTGAQYQCGDSNLPTNLSFVGNSNISSAVTFSPETLDLTRINRLASASAQQIGSGQDVERDPQIEYLAQFVLFELSETPTCQDGDRDGLCRDEDPCLGFQNLFPDQDANSDGIPDECQCGDPNLTGSYESDDLLIVFNCLQNDPSAVGVCVDTAFRGDANGTGEFESDDLLLIFNALQDASTSESFSCGARPLSGLVP